MSAPLLACTTAGHEKVVTGSRAEGVPEAVTKRLRAAGAGGVVLVRGGLLLAVVVGGRPLASGCRVVGGPLLLVAYLPDASAELVGVRVHQLGELLEAHRVVLTSRTADLLDEPPFAFLS
ncbi:hypothetical protein [Streptomyces sp. NPDC003480]